MVHRLAPGEVIRQVTGQAGLGSGVSSISKASEWLQTLKTIIITIVITEISIIKQA